MYACVLYTFKFTNENETAECFFFLSITRRYLGKSFPIRFVRLATHTHTVVN